MDWIDSVIGVESRMLVQRAKRAEIIATNIANADTPGYRARDISFDSILADARGQRIMTTVSANQRHIEIGNSVAGTTHERPSGNAAANGNTVSREFEQSAYTQNAVQYLATLRFLNGSVHGIMKALRGD